MGAGGRRSWSHGSGSGLVWSGSVPGCETVGEGCKREAIKAKTAKAPEEARYLVDRGYPKDSAVRFISNHHRLADEER
ncbi:MAG TPA: DUF434 domain-containing protein, partial [Methanothrix soehngenii]|nr:DUF434 domain-containing protein [Methanothrix soehngenii]